MNDPSTFKAMEMKTNYKVPRIVVVEGNLQSVLCTSPVPLGSTSNEGYSEEDFEW